VRGSAAGAVRTRGSPVDASNGSRSTFKDYIRRSGASRCQRLLGRGRHWRSRRANDRYEFQYPTPYRLVGDVEPPLGEESSTSR